MFGFRFSENARPYSGSLKTEHRPQGLKQWRRVRTRIQNLLKLGIRKDEAVTHGISSKGRPEGRKLVMSSSQAVHEALSLDYLAGQGLANLFTIWEKLTARK